MPSRWTSCAGPLRRPCARGCGRGGRTARASHERATGPEPRATRSSLELGQARARAGAPDAIGPLSEIVERSDDQEAITAAAIELSDMLFYAGRAAEGAAILQRAQERLPAGSSAREEFQVALLGISYTSAAARGAADDLLAELRTSEHSCSTLEATRLAALGMDEMLFLGSASKAADLAEQALAVGLPVDPQCGLNWAILVLATLGRARTASTMPCAPRT